MSEAVLIVCILSGVLSIVAIVVAVLALAGVIGLKNSTHTTQFVPVEPDSPVKASQLEDVMNDTSEFDEPESKELERSVSMLFNPIKEEREPEDLN